MAGLGRILPRDGSEAIVRPARITPQARQDIIEAVSFHDARREGLGDELYEAIRDTVNSIRTQPEAYGHEEGDIRMKLVRRFSYVIYYRVLNDRIDVLAVAHTSRVPDYWK